MKPAVIITFEPTGEVTRFALEFADLLEGLKVEKLLVNGFGKTANDRGVLVGLKKPDQPSDLAVKFIDALRRGGLEVHTTAWTVQVFQQYPLDFDLFIAPL